MFGRLLRYLAFLQLFLRKKKPKKILGDFRKGLAVKVTFRDFQKM